MYIVASGDVRPRHVARLSFYTICLICLQIQSSGDQPFGWLGNRWLFCQKTMPTLAKTVTLPTVPLWGGWGGNQGEASPTPGDIQLTKKQKQRQNTRNPPDFRGEAYTHFSSTQLLDVDFKHPEGPPPASPLESDEVLIPQPEEVGGTARPQGRRKKIDLDKDGFLQQIQPMLKRLQRAVPNT